MGTPDCRNKGLGTAFPCVPTRFNPWVRVAPTRGGMARLSWPEWLVIQTHSSRHSSRTQYFVDQDHGHRSRGTGDRSPQNLEWMDPNTNIYVLPQSLCLLCAIVHMILWYNDIVICLFTQVWGPYYNDVNKTKFLRSRPRPPEVNKGTWRI